MLRGQDMTAPTVIAKWIEVNRGTAHAEKIRQAYDDVIEFYQWQRDNLALVKRPD